MQMVKLNVLLTFSLLEFVQNVIHWRGLPDNMQISTESLVLYQHPDRDVSLVTDRNQRLDE